MQTLSESQSQTSIPAAQQMGPQAAARVGGVAQREVVEGIAHSPKLVQQKALLSGMGVAQRVGEEEEKPMQGRFVGQPVAQRVGEEEEKPMQGRFVGQPVAQRVGEEEEKPMQGRFKSAPVQRKESNNTGLPDGLKSGVENLAGLSLDSVKVHYNSDKPAQLNALAYTQGTDIHVAAGQEQHLPHEAWHVVQQAQGRVQPTMQMKEGVPVNDEVSLEHEADVMGAQAVSLANP